MAVRLISVSTSVNKEMCLMLSHKGRDISPVLLRKIARDIGMSAADLVAASA